MARILIADDEVDLVDILADILRDEGQEVRTALDGIGALREIRSWHPDVALLDVEMPGLTGPAVASELSKDRAKPGAVEVVLLSGNADIERTGAAIGVPSCVSKPIPVPKLLAVIESALARRPQLGGQPRG